ncbi:MAG: DUF1573 domain-containing protein [Chitinophagaceae bacterium]
MKKVLILLSVAAGVMACKGGDKKAGTETTTTPPALSTEEKEKAKTDTANFTTLVWLDSTYKDLGKLKKDQTVEITYRFKNTGTHNLVIDNVSAQCGCTIPEKPEKAFAPGEEGEIKAKFNGSGSGHIRKEIYVTANTSPSNSHTLAFGGEIN